MLLGFQDLLDNPNPLDPAQLEAFQLYQSDRAAYIQRIKDQAVENIPDGA